MSRNVRDVLGDSSIMTAQAVVTRAAELGAIYQDETGAWFVNPGLQAPLRTWRRSRVGVLSYLDPIRGFTAIVDVRADGPAVFGYLVLDPDLVPDGIEAETLLSTRGRQPQ